ncbi:MAG: DUF6497 family protein [Pseudomonadota bacterium]
MVQIVAQRFQHAPLSGVAAPIGRTLLGGRGCAFGLAFALSAFPASAATFSDNVPGVPSNAVVYILEILNDQTDPEDVVFRARYVMPAISRETGNLVYDDVAEDFVTLCEDHALPVLREGGFEPARIVISLSDRETEFGVADADATQLFEAFTVDGETCIWDQF